MPALWITASYRPAWLAARPPPHARDAGQVPGDHVRRRGQRGSRLLPAAVVARVQGDLVPVARPAAGPAIRPSPSADPVIITRAMHRSSRGGGVLSRWLPGAVPAPGAGPYPRLPYAALGYDVQAMSSAPAAANSTGRPDGRPAAVIHTEELTKVYPGTDFAAVDKLNLDVAGRGDLRPARAERRRARPPPRACSPPGWCRPPAGRFLAGVDVAAHPALAKQLSGIVSQQNTLDRQLTVWENLYFHGRLFGIGAKESRRTADELLEQFQLSKWAKASVYALSGGMAQRLMVARAIFHRPSVLFLDEPTAGPGPAEPAGAVGPARRAARRGPDDPAHHALHGGGRPALRAGRDHGPRQDPGPGHPGRAQAERRRRHRRHRQDHRRHRPAGRAAQPARWPASPGPGRSTAGSSCTCRAATGSCRGSCWPPSAAASTWSTCRSPSPAWRPCSST